MNDPSPQPPPPPASQQPVCFVCNKGNRVLLAMSTRLNQPPTPNHHVTVCAFCTSDWRFALTVCR